MSKDQVFANYEKIAATTIRNHSINYLQNDFAEKTKNMHGTYYDKRFYFDDKSGELYYPYMFSKTLDHNSYGFAKADSIDLLVEGKIKDFKLSNVSERKLEGAKSFDSFNLVGKDSSIIEIDYPYKVTDEAGVFEMAEVYAMSLSRPVPFVNYDVALDKEIVKELNNFDNRNINSDNIFRGHTIGGPYISQYLLLPYSIGSMPVDQKYKVEINAKNVVTEQGFLDMQNGIAGPPSEYEDATKYVYNGQVLGSIVHRDPLYNFYYAAALISLQNNIVPEYTEYNTNSSSWTSGGPPDIFSTVAAVALGALRCAWYQKWKVAMRIRPEQLAKRVNDLINTPELKTKIPGFTDLEEHLQKCPKILDKIRMSNVNSVGEENYLLNTIYPEGSPTHPSTVAGHAAVAGACVTVLKAMLKTHDNEGNLLDWPMQHMIASDDGESLENITAHTTIVDELDKLAYNVARGRDFAGVHYCVDGSKGIKLGEIYAISYLRDKCLEYSEKSNGSFTGWKLTKFDGTTITIV
jgi:hypothetical protein